VKKPKPSPKKKAAAKPAAKKSSVKSVVKKTVVKPKAKAAAKAVTKPAAKPVAKAAGKPSKPAPKAAVKSAVKAISKTVSKPAAKPTVKAVVKAVAPAKVEKVAKVTAKVEPKKADKAAKPAVVATAPKVEPKLSAKAAKAEAKAKEAAAKAAAPADAFPALDPNVKRPAKPFFMEVKPGVERVIKRGDKSAVSQVIDLQARRKGPAAEETSDELAERIERELQSQSFLKRARMRPQMCTKCGINAVTPRFTIDRELGYCEICAEILHLGETKEARRMELSLAVKKDDDEIAGPEDGPPEEAEDDAVAEDLED
jgi:hypothetical protein